MKDGELWSRSEAERLEAMADELLKEDAKEQGYVNKDGSGGWTRYARDNGMVTKDRMRTVYRHEISLVKLTKDGSDEDQLEYLKQDTQGGTE